MPKRRAKSPLPSIEELREEAAGLDAPIGFDHAALSEAALKSLVEQRPTEAISAPPTPTSDGRDKETWSFQFEWNDPRGKRYAGKFTNRILSMGLLQKVAVLQSIMQGGQPLESFLPGQLILNQALAHMSFSLVERPKWSADLTAVESVELVMKLWEKVRSHEDHYFRNETASDASDSDDE